MGKGCTTRFEAVFNIAEALYLGLWGLFVLCMIIHWMVPGGDLFDNWAHAIGVYGILPGTAIGLVLLMIKQIIEQENS